jgi:hypothetical protein
MTTPLRDRQRDIQRGNSGERGLAIREGNPRIQEAYVLCLGGDKLLRTRVSASTNGKCIDEARPVRLGVRWPPSGYKEHVPFDSLVLNVH